jgi:hypothetical protein
MATARATIPETRVTHPYRIRATRVTHPDRIKATRVTHPDRVKATISGTRVKKLEK